MLASPSRADAATERLFSLKHRGIRSLAALAAASAVLVACSPASDGSQIRGSITAVGTGIQSAAIAAWRNGWVKDFPDTSLSFSPDGASVGIKALQAGQAHFAAVDGPLSAADAEAARQSCGPDGAFSVPVAVVPVGVAFNLPLVKNLKLSPDVLAAIYSGDITAWDDAEIERLNPEADLPDTEIVPLRAAEKSALTAATTAYLQRGGWEDAGNTWPESTAGEEVPRYTDLGNEVDDTAGSIAFMDKAAIGTRFDTALLDFGRGFVRINEDTLGLSIAAGSTATGPGGSVVFTTPEAPAPGYGLTTVTYQAFCSEYQNEPLARLVRSWGEFVLGDGGQGNSSYFAGVSTPGKDALEQSRRRIAEITAAR
ncbi:phosphate transport system substrate-binding protein [Arthrobacter sp. V4I6]|nr:phosphate transport system substrate-binding protein [Arthrobacter sp. V4I6]